MSFIMKYWWIIVLAAAVLGIALVISNSSPSTANKPQTETATTTTVTTTSTAKNTSSTTTSTGTSSSAGSDMHSEGQYTADITYTLQTNIAEGRLVFIGVGGDIDGIVNPTLKVPQNAFVQVTLTNGEGALHDISFPDFNATSDHISGKDSSTSVAFKADKTGDFTYFCTVPGHRAAGMEGKLTVGQAAPKGAVVDTIAMDPTLVQTPIGTRGPQNLRVDIEAIERTAELADGSNYTFWTFDGKIPGTFIRVRVGDTVEVHFKNRADSSMIHSVDFHAVTGPGGGAALTQTPPGEEKVFTFKAINPGLYVYHCATPMVAHHITNGMYGLILVEPEGGLPKVDKEFYVMQGEMYTVEKFGQKGNLSFSVEKLLSEEPEYFVFNGAVGALTKQFPMRAKVGDNVRIFFGVGGPNYISSFHVIGEIFDKVFDQAALTAPPLTDVQTTLVPPGGATMVEFKLDVPGRYILVDHALTRLELGLVGFLYAEGEPNKIFYEGPRR